MFAALRPAAAQHAARVAEQRAHHLSRIEWLTGPSPVWACGTPVLQSDQRELVRLSRQWLAEAKASTETN